MLLAFGNILDKIDSPFVHVYDFSFAPVVCLRFGECKTFGVCNIWPDSILARWGYVRAILMEIQKDASLYNFFK